MFALLLAAWPLVAEYTNSVAGDKYIKHRGTVLLYSDMRATSNNTDWARVSFEATIVVTSSFGAITNHEIRQAEYPVLSLMTTNAWTNMFGILFERPTP